MAFIEPGAAEEPAEDPLGIVESFVAVKGWEYERDGDAVIFNVQQPFGDYKVWFVWMDTIETIQLACAFGFVAKKKHLPQINELLALINARLPPIGHFEVWPADGTLLFRHGLLLAGGLDATGKQCENMLELALGACEKYFPAFQFVVWAGKSAQEALQAAMFETQGEA